MKTLCILLVSVLSAVVGVYLAACSCACGQKEGESLKPESAQVPTWSAQDMQTFLHGSISTEIVPETVLRAFMEIYPDLFPTRDFSHVGAIPDPDFGWPVGFSRGRPAHLAKLSSVGINCASCHVGEATSPSGDVHVRILGGDSQFNVDAFVGSVLVSLWRTQDAENLHKLLNAYLDQVDPQPDPGKRAARQAQFDAAWQSQAPQIAAAISTDPAGANGAGPGNLQPLAPEAFQFNAAALKNHPDLPALASSMLKLFHNTRAALHVPDQPPAAPPPPGGPGRNDAFGLLSAGLFQSPQPFAPVKFGFVWDVEHRHYVHWDANTRSPIGRNLLAAVGLGAPMIGHHAVLDFKALAHQTDLTEKILPPRYPFAIDQASAKRGAAFYQASCASCHDGADADSRLYSAQAIGTDPLRAALFTQPQADRFNEFLRTLETPGYTPSATPGLRSTQKYWAMNLQGCWARSPYLHNGSVRTMADLLSPQASRPASFHRGSHVYDPAAMGYTDSGPYLLDTRVPGNFNTGHEYGSTLSADQKRDLIEFLKTL